MKRRGVRVLSGVKFDSSEDYERFIERVALKNKVNMGNNNAISIFYRQEPEGLDTEVQSFNKVRAVGGGSHASYKKACQEKEAFPTAG